jgi:hypothetical protein
MGGGTTMVVNLGAWDDGGHYGVVTLMDLFSLWDHQSILLEFVRYKDWIATQSQEERIQEGGADNLKKMLVAFQEECNRIGLDAVADLVALTRMECTPEVYPGTPFPTFSELNHRLEAVRFLFQSQADKHTFFRLTKEESSLFNTPQLFSKEVSDAFPSDESIYEITEAGKCLALGRYTAAVFHLMRVLEKGLKALAVSLNVQFSIPFDYLNWQNIIEQIEAEIKKLGQLPAGQVKTDTLKSYSE